MADKLKNTVSIITINLNDVQGLQKTVSSIKNQENGLYEHLIIDGGSTDGSLEFIQKNGSAFSYYISEPDKGLYDAQNKGIQQAKGEFLLFLNSGDTLATEHVISSFNKFDKQSRKLIYGNSYIFSPSQSQNNLVPPDKLTTDFWYRNTLNHQAIFFKHDLFETYGLYNCNYKFSADFDFILKVFSKEPEAFLHFNYFVCNYSETGISAKKENYSKIIDEKEEILKSNLTKESYIKARTTYFKSLPVKTRLLLYINSKPLFKKLLTKIYPSS